MVFSHQKLKKEAIDHLRKVSHKLFSPRVLLYSPVYVFLERNEKFISIKMPFQFFTEDELAKFARFKNFFLPNDVIKLDHVRHRGVTIRNALTMTERVSVRAVDSVVDVSLDPAPWEVAPVVLAECKMLWAESESLSFEAISVLIDEICGPIESKLLSEKFDQNIVQAEHSVWLANLAVLTGLHLGYVDLRYLRRLRRSVYSGGGFGSAERALVSTAQALLAKAVARKLSHDVLKSVEHPLARQMALTLSDSEEKPEVAA